MKIVICICMCQKKHVLFCGAQELMVPYETKEKALAFFKSQCEGLTLWCRVCGGRYVNYEVRETAYNTLVEAWPEVARIELESRPASGVPDTQRN